MAYVSADAVQFLPDGQLASGSEAARAAVSRLLAAPHTRIQWHAGTVVVAPGGEVAHVQGSYSYDHDAGGGANAVDRGRLIEVWKRRADGGWRCVFGSWTPETGASPAAAPAPARVPIVPTAPSAAPSPSPSPAPSPARTAEARYGAAPVGYLDALHQYFQDHLKDPESIQYQTVTEPEPGSLNGASGGVLMRNTREYGWLVKATINARNPQGAYVGPKTYQFLFRGEKLVRATAPLPDGEMLN